MCAKINEGKIAILIDGTPYALIVPRLFVENFQTFDDYLNRPYYAAFMRSIRMLSFIISVFLPGVFVAIGQQPENEPFKEVVKLNDYGYVISGEDCLPETTETGIFVAGDCRTKAIRQVTTATADGAVAALAACRVVDSLK